MFYLFEKVKEEVRWSLVIVCPKSWSLGLINMHGSLALHVLDFNWLHVSETSTIISHASCIVKIPTTIYIYIYIYLIT